MIGFSLMTKQLNIPFKSLLALGTLPRILLFFSNLHIIINELIGFQVQIFLFFSFLLKLDHVPDGFFFEHFLNKISINQQELIISINNLLEKSLLFFLILI